MAKQFNVIAQGARDYYEVALALNQVGQLKFLITDFYTPNWARILIKKRYSYGLSSSKTVSLILLAPMFKFFRSSLFGRVASVNDFILGFIGALITDLGCGRAIVYSYYIEGFWAYYKLLNRRPVQVICFQVHPTPWYVKQALENDRLAYQASGRSLTFMPEIERSYSRRDLARYATAVSGCDKVICASDVTRRSLIYGDLRVPPTYVVPYGSKLESLEPLPIRNSTAPAHVIKLITVGQLIQRKGMHWAFDAMRNLEPELQERFEWTVISNKADPAIVALAPDNVVFRTGLSDDALAEALAGSDLFVMPSVLEGFGLVYMEALSMGLPVVFTSETGISDMCTSGIDGFCVKTSSLSDLERLFKKTLDGSINLRVMKPKCAEVAARHTWQNFRSLIVDVVTAA